MCILPNEKSTNLMGMFIARSYYLKKNKVTYTSRKYMHKIIETKNNKS